MHMAMRARGDAAHAGYTSARWQPTEASALSLPSGGTAATTDSVLQDVLGRHTRRKPQPAAVAVARRRASVPTVAVTPARDAHGQAARHGVDASSAAFGAASSAAFSSSDRPRAHLPAARASPG